MSLSKKDKSIIISYTTGMIIVVIIYFIYSNYVYKKKWLTN